MIGLQHSVLQCRNHHADLEVAVAAAQLVDEALNAVFVFQLHAVAELVKTAHICGFNVHQLAGFCVFIKQIVKFVRIVKVLGDRDFKLSL